MKSEKAHIGSVAVATPEYTVSQEQTAQTVRKYYAGKLSNRSLSLMQTLLAHPSIEQRSFAVDAIDLLPDEDADARISRFTRWSVELSFRAITSALAQAGLRGEDVGALVINTCTGYICPGISTYLIEKLNLSRNVRVYDLVGGGCGGAIPNLEIAESLLKRTGGRPVVSASVEICTATFQMGNDVSLLLSNTLFADGAAAAVLWRKSEGYELVDSESCYAPEQRDAIRYVHKQGELHNKLSLKLPDMVRTAAGQVVSEVLKRNSLKATEIKHWALHSGGEKIINAVRDGLGLSDEQVLASREVLRRHGNMSSPTVWFVLHEIEKRGIAPDEWCIMVAFGAGLSAHAFLLRKK